MLPAKLKTFIHEMVKEVSNPKIVLKECKEEVEEHSKVLFDRCQGVMMYIDQYYYDLRDISWQCEEFIDNINQKIIAGSKLSITLARYKKICSLIKYIVDCIHKESPAASKSLFDNRAEWIEEVSIIFDEVESLCSCG